MADTGRKEAPRSCAPGRGEREAGSFPPSDHPVDQRMARVVGQVEGIRRMAQDGRDCIDILTQLAAARAALEQVGIEILTHHMRDCAGGEGCRPKGLTDAERTAELRTVLNRLLK